MSQADKKKKADDYTYEPESGEGDYYISERPWSPNCLGTDSHAIKIRVEHATKYTMSSMGKRYCFAFGNFIKIEYEKYKGMHLSYWNITKYLAPIYIIFLYISKYKKAKYPRTYQKAD